MLTQPIAFEPLPAIVFLGAGLAVCLAVINGLRVSWCAGLFKRSKYSNVKTVVIGAQVKRVWLLISTSYGYYADVGLCHVPQSLHSGGIKK